MPKVSVIMGIYNTNNETMVKEAIDSILNQTYKNYEFIICDDGSTDGTYELIKKLTMNDDRVVLIKNEKNMGLAYTLNHCLEVAKGEYIARMDADDISVLDRLEKQVEFLDRNDEYAVVGSSAKLFDENGQWGMRCPCEKPIKESFLFGTCFIHPTVMIRRSVLDKVSGYRVSDETLRAEDYDLFMRIYSAGGKGYNLQETLYEFREDKNAYKRRSYKFRIGEAKVRYIGFKRLGLLPKGYLYVMKPLIVGLIPQVILAKLRSEKIISERG